MEKAELELVVANPAGTSAQSTDDVNRFTPENALPTPANYDNLAGLTQVSRTRRSCIEAIAVNTVGLGVNVVPREGMEDEVSDEDEPRKVLATLDALARRDTRSQATCFADILYGAKWDEEEVGQGAIEVSRNKMSGQIDGLFYAPGKRVRRRIDRDGWVIGPRKGTASERVEFYNFGDGVSYGADGKPESISRDGRRKATNELLFFRVYTSESTDYGMPRDAQLALDYLADKNAAQANVSFFDNQGVPPTVIFVQGEVELAGGKTGTVKVGPKLVQQITDTLRADAGHKHRVAIVPVPPGTKSEAHDLAVLSDRDMGFVEFRRDNRRATIGAFRLTPIYVADIEDTNYSTALVELRIPKIQVFDIEQARWSRKLDPILRDLGFPHLRFRFTEIDVEEVADKRAAANDAADRGAITFGEFREAQGRKRLPEAQADQEAEPGQVELGWNDRLMPSRSAAPVLPVPADGEEPVIKSDDELRMDFEASVEDAIRRVRKLHDGDLETVVVEKDGDRIVISPYSGNGAQRP